MSRTFVPGVVRRRIVNTALLHTKKQRLMSIVTEHFYQKEKNNELPVAILSHAVECHGAEDGAHMTHVGLATGLLLQRMMEKTDRYHLEQADIEAIRMVSELHDIGKLQIPAEILTKPGALTAEECEIVKRHTVLGAKTITELPICQNERLADERPAQRMTPVMAEDDASRAHRSTAFCAVTGRCSTSRAWSTPASAWS